MKTRSLLTSPCFLFFLAFSLQPSLSTGLSRGPVSLPAANFFHLQSLHTGFTNISVHEQTVVLLQEDGSVDIVKSLMLELPRNVSADDVALIQDSSNERVLNITDNTNLLKTNSPGIMNVTYALSFDEMVGKTDYTITARQRSTEEILSSVTIPFVIVGVTLYVQDPQEDMKIVSGATRRYTISYLDALQGTVTDSYKIRALIQYPNGTSSADLSPETIVAGDSLQSSVSGLRGQFFHKESQCSLSSLGTMQDLGSIKLPTGCGYGFYVDLSGHLCFGFVFEPYRAGNLRIQFSWAGLTANFSSLSGELFETSLDIFVSGEPPVAVEGIVPSHGLLRPEGGEILTAIIINSELHSISSFHMQAQDVSEPFNMVPGSFHEHGFPDFIQEVSFMTAPGSGSDLNWSLFYQVNHGRVGDTVERSELAAFLPHFDLLLSYDTESLRIDSMEPAIGSDEGGEMITVTGHFPHFNPRRDGFFFSGVRLPQSYFVSVSANKIIIKSPPKAALGSSYDYFATVRMGNGVSNEKKFSFIVRHAEVRVSQSGTSEIDEETFGVGDCTPVRFTAVVVPYTSQIQSYLWTFHVNGDTENDLLQTEALSYTNASAQTLELLPDSFEVGSYTLKITVTMLGNVLETELLLMRQHVTSIGAFILKPPVRSIAFPDTPLRLSAVVRSPGDCYNGTQAMTFEWEAFGVVKRFSSTNTTGSPSAGQLTTTPARLGWEYVVPRESLKLGNHSVVFKVWMSEQPEVSGQAMSRVIIHEGPLEAVIRQGENRVTVNYVSTLSMTASNSYDPDVLGSERNAGLTYEWSCRQSSTNNFSMGASSSCNPVLLSNNSAAFFLVPMNTLEALPEVKFIQYTLVARKGMSRVSAPKFLVVEIQGEGKHPHLDEYTIELTGADGTVLDWNHVPYYEQAILTVSAPNRTWTYEILDPSISNFFSSSYLINSPLFYSLEANIFSVTGTDKPLGIEAGKMDPFTTYTFQILFDACHAVEATTVTISLRTTEAPTIGFPLPSITNGTTETMFTSTAGIPSTTSTFSYYFMMTDSAGKEFCVGGCTGYDVVHFQIGRPGNYSFTAYVLDMQGKALLDQETLPQNITIHNAGATSDYQAQLSTMFANGNDHSWTQLARDLALILLEPETFDSEERMLLDSAARKATRLEDLLAARMQIAYNISSGSRQIYCSCFPNTYHGRDCIKFALDLARQSILDEQTVYNIIQTVECCVKNTPLRTINLMGPEFPAFLAELNRLSRNLFFGGSSRRRLLEISTDPANLIADVQTVTGENMGESLSSGKLDGFASQHDIGEFGEYGQVSVMVASNPAHLPSKMVNGELRKTIMGRSMNELFYATSKCLLNIFSENVDDRRVIVLHTTENFVLFGFQDPPLRYNLAESLYWTQIFERDASGAFKHIATMKDGHCFCWRLPVERNQEFLETSIDDMPGILAISDLKTFNVSVSEKGKAFSYVYDDSKTSDFNATEGWVEGCREGVGLVSTTIVSKKTSNVLADDRKGRVLGTGVQAVIGLVLGGLALVVIAMVSSWLFAVRSMADSAAPMASLVPNELYVERDVYGRGTIFDVNAVRVRSND